ncbi:hypothetical protein Pan216_20160 [Planctomycetes bacterium Pan216]|uniref:Uncharacterized protein n=1 Tax=Kolteria novifilia TaxID=2527975 RepID=A0A518B2J1_9BACT|nr:hypothetical protein Pan216_20160 [Planctomycetes bacterium Pan216]
MKWWLIFVICTILAWGCYVPTIHMGQGALGGLTESGKPNFKAGGLRAFLCVGLAYFLTAVIIPGIIIGVTPAEQSFTMKGTTISTLAGIFGAIGALGIILAIRAGGHPVYIVPLVFSGAPIVGVVVGMILHPPHNAPSPIFYAGIVLAAIGAGLVLFAKPA